MITNTTEFTKTVYMSMEGKKTKDEMLKTTTMLKIQKTIKSVKMLKTCLKTAKKTLGQQTLKKLSLTLIMAMND